MMEENEDIFFDQVDEASEIPFITLIKFITNSTIPSKSSKFKDHLISFVCQYLGVNLEQLSSQSRTTLERKVFKFLQTFRKKLGSSKKSRHIEFLLKDNWSKNNLTFFPVQKRKNIKQLTKQKTKKKFNELLTQRPVFEV